MKGVKSLGIRLGAALVVAGAGLLGTAPNASAASVIYTAQTTTAPNSNALQNMTHQNAYSWQLEGINLQNNSITKAVLTFNGFFNWTDVAHDPYNILWVDLLDPTSHTANGAISTFSGDDTNTGPLGINDVLDCFRFSNYPSGTDKSCAGFVPNSGSTYVGSSNNASDASVTVSQRRPAARNLRPPL